MNVFITLRVGLRALMRNKIRSCLTILGIIVGISAVIAVIAVGQGATVMIQAQMNSMGNNLLIVFPGSALRGGFHFGMGTRSSLTIQDMEAIAEESSFVKAITPVVYSSGQLVYQEKNWATRIQGVTPSYLTVRNWELETGSFFTETDVRSATKICVIGATITRELFGEEDAVNKILRIKNMPFRIVGVLTKKGSAVWGQDQDDVVIAPWTTVRRILQNTPFSDVNQIMISLNSLSLLNQAREEIIAILRQRHHLAENAENDFTISDVTEMTNMITQTSKLMSLLLVIIASISLVVGGIGIMNIMLVSVTERTREIGLRMAVGARGKDILLQFLVESVVLACVGGALGIILGNVTAQIISRTNHWPVIVSANSILLAFGFSAAVGIFFGFYPAWRASRLNPIEALRYE